MSGRETLIVPTRRYSLRGKRIFVAGHRGMVGSAIVRRLARIDCKILTADRSTLDLTRQADVERWMARNRPDAVFIAAARVGGILANSTRPADFLYENLIMAANIIDAAWRSGVEKLLFLGSTCIYPRLAPQPMPEASLLTGPLEPTNEWYAIAKIAGLKMCAAYRAQHGADFISAMPTNLYGPGDTYDLNSSHVVAALIRKTHEAKQAKDGRLVIWGSGKPRREFMHVDDCADALVHVMQRYSAGEHINVGTGEEVSIRDLANLTTRVVGFKGPLEFDRTKPDGTPRKLVSSERLSALGWRPRISLEAGLRRAYADFLKGRVREPAVTHRAAGPARKPGPAKRRPRRVRIKSPRASA